MDVRAAYEVYREPYENNVCFIVLTKVACLVCYDGFVAMTLLSLFR